MWCFVSLSLVVSTSAIDCLERLVSEMTCYVSSETLNPRHSLTAIIMIMTMMPLQAFLSQSNRKVFCCSDGKRPDGLSLLADSYVVAAKSERQAQWQSWQLLRRPLNILIWTL